jgi:chromosome segregation ATPase
MKTEKIKEHLKEIENELAYIRGMLQNVSNQMQELRDSIRGAPHQTEELRMRELYEHPWYKYKRQELVASGNYYGNPEGNQDVSI